MTEVRFTTETADDAAGSGGTVPDSGPREEFIKLFTRYQRRVFLFILSQVPSPMDAEEIHQEANVIIWRKFDRFELGTNGFDFTPPPGTSSLAVQTIALSISLRNWS